MNHAVHDSAAAPCLALADEAATLAAGARLAAALEPATVVYLHGDLGAGKTTLARGVLRGLGFAGKVRSPTYTLVEIYAIPRLDFNLTVYHFDFYRLGSPDEFSEAGLDEYFDGRAICLVEWPDKAAGCVPPPDLDVQLEPDGTGRSLRLQAGSERGQRCLTAFLMAACPTPPSTAG